MDSVRDLIKCGGIFIATMSRHDEGHKLNLNVVSHALDNLLNRSLASHMGLVIHIYRLDITCENSGVMKSESWLK